MAKRSYRKKSGRKSKRSGRKSAKRSGRKSKRSGRKSKRSGRKSKRSGRKSKRSGRKSAKRVRAGSRKIKNSPCAIYKKKQCGSVDPNCGWVKKRGCSRRRGAASGSVYEGPSYEPFASGSSFKPFSLGPPPAYMRRRRHSRR